MKQDTRRVRTPTQPVVFVRELERPGFCLGRPTSPPRWVFALHGCVMKNALSCIWCAVGLAVVLACGSTSSPGGVPEKDEAPEERDEQNCISRCTTVANRCGQPSDECSRQCGSLTEAQLSCVERAGCEAGTIKKCMEGGAARSDAGEKADGGSNSNACVAIGASGCYTHNAPSGCCTDSRHPTVVCYGNNDGNDNAQCCVERGDPCTKVTDCCGYGAAPDVAKPYFSCTEGVCKY